MAGITDRNTNPKKSRNGTVAGVDILSTPISTTSERATPGPSGVKVSDASDTDDYEMEVTDEFVSHPWLLFPESHFSFPVPGPIR